MGFYSFLFLNFLLLLKVKLAKNVCVYKHMRETKRETERVRKRERAHVMYTGLYILSYSLPLHGAG